MHAFSCKRTSSRIQHHNYINDIIWRALGWAAIPCRKEPQFPAARTAATRALQRVKRGFCQWWWCRRRRLRWRCSRIIGDWYIVHFLWNPLSLHGVNMKCTHKMRNRYAFYTWGSPFRDNHWSALFGPHFTVPQFTGQYPFGHIWWRSTYQ